MNVAKKELLTPEQVRDLFDYSPDTGVLTWRIRPSQITKAGDIAGTVRTNGYLQVCARGRRYLVHRLAWAHTHGVWPQGDIDHINGIKTDNRIANLRDVSRSVNIQNRKNASPLKKSGAPLGVTWIKRDRKWLAKIVVDGKRRHIGVYDDKDEAHRAYVQAKRELHDGCTL